MKKKQRKNSYGSWMQNNRMAKFKMEANSFSLNFTLKTFVSQKATFKLIEMSFCPQGEVKKYKFLWINQNIFHLLNIYYMSVLFKVLYIF